MVTGAVRRKTTRKTDQSIFLGLMNGEPYRRRPPPSKRGRKTHIQDLLNTEFPSENERLDIASLPVRAAVDCALGFRELEVLSVLVQEKQETVSS